MHTPPDLKSDFNQGTELEHTSSCYWGTSNQSASLRCWAVHGTARGKRAPQTRSSPGPPPACYGRMEVMNKVHDT